VIIASNGRLVSYPAWYYNLSAEPGVAIEIGGEQLPMQSATAEGTERARLYAKVVERYPDFTKDQGGTRELPVVLRPPS
jgi:deazaflavin-dependent oxidoreductase (nitroreductase family)